MLMICIFMFMIYICFDYVDYVDTRYVNLLQNGALSWNSKKMFCKDTSIRMSIESGARLCTSWHVVEVDSAESLDDETNSEEFDCCVVLKFMS